LLAFKDDKAPRQLIAESCERGRIVTLICHSSALLPWPRLSNGKLLAQGMNWLGFPGAKSAGATAQVLPEARRQMAVAGKTRDTADWEVCATLRV